MRTERPTCRECACAKVCEYHIEENGGNLDERCSLEYWENYFVPKQEWISVDERLPEENVRVLVWLQDNAQQFIHIDTDRRLHGKWVRWVTDVTHWMPLPEAPKGGAE